MPRDESTVIHPESYRKWYIALYSPWERKACWIVLATLEIIAIGVILLRTFVGGDDFDLPFVLLYIIVITLLGAIVLIWSYLAKYRKTGRIYRYNIHAPKYRTTTFSLSDFISSRAKAHGYEIRGNTIDGWTISRGEESLEIEFEEDGKAENLYFTFLIKRMKASEGFVETIKRIFEKEIDLIYSEKRLAGVVCDHRGTKYDELDDDDYENALPISEWIRGSWKFTYAETVDHDGGRDEKKITLFRTIDTPENKIVFEESPEDQSSEIWHAPLAFNMGNYSGGYFLLKDDKSGDFILPNEYKNTGKEILKVLAGRFDTVKISFKGFVKCDYCHGKKRLFKCPFCEGKGGRNKDEDLWYDSLTGVLIKTIDKDEGEGTTIVKELTSYEGVLREGAP